MLRPAGLTGWVLPAAVYVEPDPLELSGVMAWLLYVVFMGFVVGAAFKLLYWLVARYGPVGDPDPLPYGTAVAAGSGGVAAALVVLPQPHDSPLLLASVVGAVACWTVGRAIRRFGADGPADRAATLLARYGVPGGAVVAFGSIAVLSWGNGLFLGIVLWVAAILLAVLLTTVGTGPVRRYLPDTDRAVLPSHYAGLLQRSTPGSTRECPDCGTRVDGGDAVCPDCSATLSGSQPREGGETANTHLLE